MLRTRCCRQNVSSFAHARNICCGHKFCVQVTKNVSNFVQKHFVSATNVPSLRSSRNIIGNNVTLFTRALKFAKLRTNMSARALLFAKFSELFAISLILPSKHPSLRQFQTKKHSFKPLFWNVDENCNVDAVIDRAGYQSKKQLARKKLLFKFSLVFLLRQARLRVFMVLFLYLLCCQRQQQKRKHYSQVFTRLFA